MTSLCFIPLPPKAELRCDSIELIRVFVDPSPPSLQLRHFTTLSIEARFCQSEVEVPNDEDDAVLVLGLLFLGLRLAEVSPASVGVLRRLLAGIDPVWHVRLR